MLNTYLTQVQNLLHDTAAQFYSTGTLTTYINAARGQIAAEGECVRVLPPSSGPISSFTVTAGGSGYVTAPTVSISGNGSGASGTAVLSGATVASITLVSGGSGYSAPVNVTLSGGSGSGATATATINNVNQTTTGQEVYTFASVNPLVQLTGGVNSILAVRSVSVSWGSMRPTLRFLSWGSMQAYLRAYNIGVQSYPEYWSQFAQGVAGSIYLWPIPSQISAMDWDCVCLPIDLATDGDTEAIPYPWTDAVQFYACYLAFMSAQRNEDADRMYRQYQMFMQRARAFSVRSMVADYYSN